MAPYNADIAAMVFHRQVAPHALGREVPSPWGEGKGEGVLEFCNLILETEHDKVKADIKILKSLRDSLEK